jgi:biotin operon repressor
MAPSNQSTKLRLLKLLQYSLATQPNTAVSLSELARTLHISRERVRQLYQQLKAEYTLPPVKKTGRGINRYNQVVVKAEQWALAQQVKALREKRVYYKQIQKELGISRYQISQAIKQLRRAKDTVRKLPSPKTLAFETEVRTYSKQGLTVAEMAKKVRRPPHTIYTVLHRLGVPLRKQSRRSR